MLNVTVLLFADLPGGLEPHEEADFRIAFRRVAPDLKDVPPEGPFWAFVDWDTSDLPGLEICRRLRCDPRTAQTHIVMALAEATARNRRCAAQVGATEYLERTITRDLVITMIEAQRSSGAAGQQSRLGNLTVDFAAYQARWRNKPLRLMPTQLRLLHFFVEHPGQIFTRRQLMEALGNLEERMEERTVDVWIGRLRRELKAVGASDLLRTVRSLGYMLVPPKQG